MHTGTYTQLLDSKGRIILPGAFRQEFGSSFTCSLGFDGCLCLWRQEDWQVFVDREISQRSQFSRAARDVNRYLHNNAFHGEFDSQFRFTVPPVLRKHAALERELVLAGTGNRIEIWSRSNWDAYNARIAGNIEDIADSLATELRV